MQKIYNDKHTINYENFGTVFDNSFTNIKLIEQAMKPLNVAFLWHQHQPYYRWEDEFILPWVRMHGVKDYYDLPALIKQFPSIKQTFNFAPSLMLQIEEYVSGKIKDRVQILSEKSPDDLNEKEKEEILKQFFVCNYDNLIKPHSRYLELYDKHKEKPNEIGNFDYQDFLDLQVWYNLTWIGEISKQDAKITEIIKKARNFSEEDKQYVLKYHIDILKKIPQIMNQLKDSGQIEISCSPEYHPILPILIDHRSALEAMPWIDLSSLYYRYPEDADAQISRGIEIYERTFNEKPKGVWPSEGSLSDSTLDMLGNYNFNWAATDEQMLKETAKDSFYDTLKFFPQQYSNSEKGINIKLLFRDHFLSDRIGFVYSKWDPKTAAEEFCSHLDNIRNEIIRVHGEESLDFATVTVILDGENCWEFYKDNGFPFLKRLFQIIQDSPQFNTVKCSEAASNYNDKYSKTFTHIHSGSWINANFAIWIGHRDDILAWKMLARARNEVESRKSSLSPETLAEVMNEIYIAEGSDWYWWYGPEHNAPNKPDFDVLFRRHIDRIYKLIQVDTPLDVYSPINSDNEYQRFRAAKEKIFPNLSGAEQDSHNWDNAAFFNVLAASSTMHQSGDFLTRLLIGNNDSHVFFRVEFSKQLDDNEFCLLTIDNTFVMKFFSRGVEIIKSTENIRLQKFIVKDYCDISLEIFRKKEQVKMTIGLKTISDRVEIDHNSDFPIYFYFV